MQILYVVKDLPAANIESMLEEVSPRGDWTPWPM